eukprot:m.101737 g.101737  ORF g.101737 m.101737 type:complete len:388 (-) comp27346_c2_seq1:41-1204(-)
MAVLLQVDTVGKYVFDLVQDGKIKIDLPKADVETFSAAEIGGGNLNYAFRVSSPALPGGSVFVKQAPEFIKCLGPEYKLTQDRIRVEALATENFNRLTEYSAKLLCYDEMKCTIVLEDLRDYELLRDVHGLGWCADERGVAQNLSKFMIQLHEGSVRSSLTPEQIDTYEKTFSNTDMCGVTSEYVFTKAFRQDDTNRWDAALTDDIKTIHNNTQFCMRVLELKKAFNTVKTSLVHGDLHTGSIMVDKAGNTKVIDAEFAFYGPPEFDVALALAGFCFSTLYSVDVERMSARGAIEIIWTNYFKAMTSQSASLVLGFCGCEMMRRVIGAAHWPPVDSIDNEETRRRVERAVLRFGQFCIISQFETQESALQDVLQELDKLSESIGVKK